MSKLQEIMRPITLTLAKIKESGFRKGVFCDLGATAIGRYPSCSGLMPDILPRFTPEQALWAGAPMGTAAARDLQVAFG